MTAWSSLTGWSAWYSPGGPSGLTHSGQADQLETCNNTTPLSGQETQQTQRGKNRYLSQNHVVLLQPIKKGAAERCPHKKCHCGLSSDLAAQSPEHNHLLRQVSLGGLLAVAREAEGEQKDEVREGSARGGTDAVCIVTVPRCR